MLKISILDRKGGQPMTVAEKVNSWLDEIRAIVEWEVDN